MRPFPNLISHSVLVRDTVNYLRALGGKAPAVRIVDRVMKIRNPEPSFALLLVSDLVQRDGRLAIVDDQIELIECRQDQIDLAETDFVVLDVETTGSKAPPCRVIEIGAFRVSGGQVTEKFHSLIDPETPIPPFIASLTGIDDMMVSDAPKFSAIADNLLKFIGNSVVVAHNIEFDLGFLNHEIGRVYEDYRLGNPTLCTVQLSRGLISEIENHKLKTVADYYAVELINHHRAGDDAHATAKIFVRLLRELELIGVNNIGAARRLGRRKKYVGESTAAA